MVIGAWVETLRMEADVGMVDLVLVVIEVYEKGEFAVVCEVELDLEREKKEVAFVEVYEEEEFAVVCEVELDERE